MVRTSSIVALLHLKEVGPQYHLVLVEFDDFVASRQFYQDLIELDKTVLVAPYLLFNCFSGQFGEILTEVCKICTSAAREILSKLRPIFTQI